MFGTGNYEFLEKKAAETQTEIILDLENDAEVISSDDLNAISQMYVYDHLGNRHKMNDIYADFKTIFVFVRVKK